MDDLDIIKELRSVLIAYADHHPAPVALANICGMYVYELVDTYLGHLENKQHEELLKHWGPDQADREVWNFIRWTLENFGDDSLIQQLINEANNE